MRNSLILNALKSLMNDGLIKTLVKVKRYQNFKKNVLGTKTTEDRFTWIYSNNYWGSVESASGTGSTLQYTENLRKSLPGLFKRFSIEKIFDAPCGDFNWMSQLLPTTNVIYIGGDIVRPLIESLNDKYGSKKISFIHINLIDGKYPEADLMICRDCLFHLSFSDAKKVLNNFLASGIRYLLTTTHVNSNRLFANEDILTGDFRLIDLFSPPYSLPSDPIEVIDDWVFPDPERVMCLWTREQVMLALKKVN